MPNDQAPVALGLRQGEIAETIFNKKGWSKSIFLYGLCYWPLVFKALVHTGVPDEYLCQFYLKHRNLDEWRHYKELASYFRSAGRTEIVHTLIGKGLPVAITQLEKKWDSAWQVEQIATWLASLGSLAKAAIPAMQEVARKMEDKRASSRSYSHWRLTLAEDEDIRVWRSLKNAIERIQGSTENHQTGEGVA